MAIKSAKVNIAGTAVELVASVGVPGYSIALRNTHVTESIWVGGPDVTTVNGFEILPTQLISLDLFNQNTLYAISDGTTVVASLLWTGA